MKMQQNIYNYSTPKSCNEETNFFNIKGRITVATFFLRFFLAIAIYYFSWGINNFGIYKKFGLRFENFFETIHLYILPLFLFLFVLIQGAKRVHDINKSGWYFFIPVYNIFLCLGKGTEGSNDYGIDPKPMKSVTYFDEIEPKSNAEKVTNSKLSSKFNKSYLPLIIVFLVIFFAIRYSTMHKSIDTVVDDSTIIAPDSTNAKSGIDDSELIDNKNTNSGFDESDLINQSNITWETETNGYFIDERDDNKYKVVKIGDNIWMADNLRFNSEESVSLNCSDKNDASGKLYNWDDAKEVAPKDWHLPSKKEYDQLLHNLTDSQMLDSNYFNAYNAGYAFLSTARCSDQYPQFENWLTFWTSSPYGKEVAWALEYTDRGFVLTWDSSYRKGRTESGSYYGVRCIFNN